MNAYNLLIIFIILIKIIFILLKLTTVYNKLMNKSDTPFGINILYWTDRIEFIYKISMAFLIIALFKSAITEGMLCIYDKETLFLMYIFGFILLFTADWTHFISESVWITKIQTTFGIKTQNNEKNIQQDEVVGYYN